MRILLFISTTRSQRYFWSVICDLVVHKICHNFPFCKQLSIIGILIMMIMTTTNSICTTILVQRKTSYLVEKLFIIFCFLRTLMMMMEATTEKKADNLSATKSMLVFLCRNIIGKFAVDCFFADKPTEKCQDFTWYWVSATSPPSPSWSSWSRWSGPTPPTDWPELSWSSSTCLPPSW